MRDLIETLISILIALALVAATYQQLVGHLATLVSTTFDNLAH